MKSKMSIGILAVLVCMLMLMPNTLASAGPPIWINQATLSTGDSNPSQDPENSGFGTLQVAVWEEYNGNDWDIFMKYNLFDGAPGWWVFPPVHPAITGFNERKPAVTVTNLEPVNGLTEIHVVYERFDPNTAQWDIYHTYTQNLGIIWIVPAGNPLNQDDAHDPAIVYTEEVSNPIPPQPWYGMCIQIVWSEFITLARGGANLYEIRYNAYYFDPTVRPFVWLYAALLLPAPPASIRVRGAAGPNPPTGNCEKPEIASVDETLTLNAWEYYFAIVWEETSAGVIDIGYADGWLNIIPAPVAFVTISTGKLNPNPAGTGNCRDPDIAATQDYQNPAIALEEFYYHVNWVYTNLVPVDQIVTCYAAGPAPIPGLPMYIATLPAVIAPPGTLDRPTIASKLIARWPPFTTFETWMCWEDNNVPGSAPDIWYIVGQWNNIARIFAYTMPAALIVPYVQPIGGASEYNPELWNRNDAVRLLPPVTHLVFDMTTGLAGNQEVEYIDP